VAVAGAIGNAADPTATAALFVAEVADTQYVETI
jgi:hypothetical protein